MILFRNRVILIILCFVTFSILTSCSENTKVTNSQEKFVLLQADGSKLVLDKKPERVVVLSLATATILDSLNINIVGLISTEREISEKLAKLPKVGSPIKPNIEKILELNPDLVITSQTFYNVQKDMFAKNKINVLFIENTTYEDTKNSIRYFGKYFERVAEADKLVMDFETMEKNIIKATEDKNKSRTIILHANNKEIQMATKNSFAGSIAEKLGVFNIADSIDTNNSQTYIKLSIEHIAKENPDKILVIIHSKNKNLKQSIDNEIKNNKLWQSTTAVKNHKIFYLDEELFYANPGIKCTDALKYLADIIYQ